MALRAVLLGIPTMWLALAVPAEATLQLNASISGAPLVCSDGQACDVNPATGVLQLATTTVNGVLVSGSFTFSMKSAGNNILSSNSITVTNNSGGTRSITAAVADTGFVPPASNLSLSASGTWLFTNGSNIAMGWYLDPTNAQGADTPTDTPGSLLDTFSDHATGTTDSFSHTKTVPVSVSAPFSMTETFTYTLVAGGELTSRGQTELSLGTLPPPEVPEPATLALIGPGLLALGVAVSRRRR